MYNSEDYIHPAYTDPVFKHLMSFDDIRNTFLSVVLQKDILESQMADPALAPFDENHQARALVDHLNKNESRVLLEGLKKSVTGETKSLLEKALECLSLVQSIFPDK
ncbi:MAG: hypothetical protein FJ161_02900 [Gammaproteobacteria bacterium]|nr:hypothetical protein [Gammaproteobacteria bacterium]